MVDFVAGNSINSSVYTTGNISFDGSEFTAKSNERFTNSYKTADQADFAKLVKNLFDSDKGKNVDSLA